MEIPKGMYLNASRATLFMRTFQILVHLLKIYWELFLLLSGIVKVMLVV